MNKDDVSKRIKGIVGSVDPYLSSGGVVKDKVHVPVEVWNDLRQLAKDLTTGAKVDSAGQAVAAEREEEGVLLPPAKEQSADSSDHDQGYVSGWNEAVKECRRLNKTGSKM